LLVFVSLASPNLALPVRGTARLVKARRHKEGKARHGKDSQGKGKARQGNTRRVKAKERQGKATQGEARQREGNARRGKAKDYARANVWKQGKD
jgi:hypothetical protein